MGAAVETGPKLRRRERLVLQYAASHPGARLQIAAVKLNRSPSVVRAAASKLRQHAFMYSSKPAWLILTAHGEARWDKLEVPPWLQSRGEAILDLVKAHDGAMPKEALKVPEHEVGAYQKALDKLREARVLHPWDGLVLTEAGREKARELGFRVVKG